MIRTSVSNGTGQCKFLGQRDRNSFLVPGQRDNRTSSKSATRRDFDSLSRPIPGRDRGTEMKEKEFFSDFSSSSCFGTYFFCFRTSFSCFRTSFPVLERPFPVSERHFPVLERPFSVLERLFPGFWGVILSRDVQGQKSLSRDICSCPCPGTRNFFCPGTSRPLETLI